MRLAFIPPFSLLETTFQTDYQLMLPQLVDRDERYSYAYSKHCQDPDTFVILDNGAAEGEQVHDKHLLETAIRFRVDELVIPDVMCNRTATLDKAGRFWRDWHDLHLWKFVRRMFVVQGSNYSEFLSCILWATEQEWIDTIAIPRHAVTTCGRLDTRTGLAHYVLAHSDKAIHFLGGAPTYPHELAVLAKEFYGIKQVRGMDTSMPFNYAWWGEGVLAGQSGCKRPDNYFELAAEEFNQEEYLLHNLETMKRWAMGDE